jgi:hypothetical protein
MESAFPSQDLWKRPLCNICWNGWHITRGTQPKRMLLCLESCSYNKSHPSPKAYCFSKIVDKKPFLVCFKSLLDSLSSTCMSSTPTKYTPWFASNIKPYHAGSTNIYPIALLELVCRSFQASTLHGVGPLPSHVVMISLVPSCMCHVWVSKGMLSW